jgi:hypothetical protein
LSTISELASFQLSETRNGGDLKRCYMSCLSASYSLSPGGLQVTEPPPTLHPYANLSQLVPRSHGVPTPATPPISPGGGRSLLREVTFSSLLPPPLLLPLSLLGPRPAVEAPHGSRLVDSEDVPVTNRRWRPRRGGGAAPPLNGCARIGARGALCRAARSGWRFPGGWMTWIGYVTDPSPAWCQPTALPGPCSGRVRPLPGPCRCHL